MRARLVLLLSLAIGVALSRGEPSRLWAQPAEEEEKGITYPSLHPPEKPPKEPFRLLGAKQQTIRVAYTQGFDDNVSLNSFRKGDSFSQESVDIVLAWRVWGRGRLLLQDYLSNANFYEITDANLVDNIATATLVWPFGETIQGRFGFYHEFFWQPRFIGGTYNEFGPRVEVRQLLIGKSYHGITYTFFGRFYTDRRARSGNNTDSDDYRQDQRHALEHELVLPAAPKTLFKLRNRFFTNDSNDQFNDAFDSWSYRSGLTLYQYLTDALGVAIGLSYEFRNFYSRRVPNTQNTEAKDNVWGATLGAIYTISKHWAVMASYTYRQSGSNDPKRDYAGSVGTVGVNYTF